MPCDLFTERNGQFTVDGRIYSLPTGQQFDLLYADEKFFRRMGYDVSDVPRPVGISCPS